MAEFEWDPEKERINTTKHKVDFRAASRIWEGIVLQSMDDRRDYGEIRIQALGEVDGRLMVVVFTWRGTTRRIISARKANPREQGDLKRRSVGKAKGRRTDWTAFDALTDEDIAAAIQDDPDVAPELDDDWFASATLVMPRPKEQISIRLDRDVLEHFRKYPRYQTRINAILRAAMEHEKKAG